MYQPFVPEQEQIQAFLASRLRLLDESGFGLLAEVTFFFRNHKGTSMLEMPSIESDFPVLGGVDFNLLYCYESPGRKAFDGVLFLL
jgi:hypothetical protein